MSQRSLMTPVEETSARKRALWYVRLLPGTEAEFDRRSAAVWPDLATELRESGLRNMTGFRRGTDVWCYLEGGPDIDSALANLESQPAHQRWNHCFRDVFAQTTDDSGNLLRYDQVFGADGSPADGPFERGLFGLVIDPERAIEYDALHADAWPELMDALQASGFRNYNGFRRGAHVVYYGEFYPDLMTALARMARHDVNARWGKAFQGIITTMTDPNGNHLVATQVFHHD